MLQWEAVTAVLRTLLDKLTHELEPLLESGDNWQVAVHGGRGGDVVIKVERTCQVLAPSKPAAAKADSCRG